MAISDYLTPEQLQIMLDETYGNQQTQDFIRPNPLQFQYPYIPGGIMNTGSVMYDEFPQGFSFRPQGLDTSRFTGVDLESGYLDRAGSYGQDVYAEQEKGGGIGDLFKFLAGLAVPGAGFLMNLPGRGLERIRNLNQRLRATDFGQSKTLQEYMSRRKERDAIARAQEAAPSVYESARDQGFTGPRGGFSTTGRYNESAFSSTKSSRGRQDF